MEPWMFDADNHYYEAEDAFTRHGDADVKAYVRWVSEGKRRHIMFGNNMSTSLPNPTFDPIAKPGIFLERLLDLQRGKGTRVLTTTDKNRYGELEPISAAYRDHDARVEVMDEQGVERCLLFPTLGVGVEGLMTRDIEMAYKVFHAFNLWLDDDWGFAYKDRIFGVPYLTLSDLDNALAELEWVLERDARVVLISTGPVMTAEGLKSPADPRFDPYWARVQEAGVATVFHGGDSAYRNIITMWGESADMEAHKFEPLRQALSPEVVADTLAAIILHGLLDRFPRLRFATVETGADWVAPLQKRLKKLYSQTPLAFKNDPIEQFTRNVWVSPFYENDLDKLREIVPADHLLLGSDWPHTEGLRDPLSFTKDLAEAGFTTDEQQLIMYDNCKQLVQRQPA